MNAPFKTPVHAANEYLCAADAELIARLESATQDEIDFIVRAINYYAEHAVQTRTVFRQGDRKKHPTPVKVKHLTADEVRSIPTGSGMPLILNDGRLGRCKVTSFRSWKTDPNRIAIGVKYGMYEFAKFDLEEAMRRFVKEEPC